MNWYFIDPPYSSAQYSRFYHVLEAVAVGGFQHVYGEGRAPDLQMREQSTFSLISGARNSMEILLNVLADKGCRVVATFPQYKASNGLAGDEIVEIATERFQVDVSATSNRFSTLGGNGAGRSSANRFKNM